MHICYLEKKKSAILGKIRNKASLYTYICIYISTEYLMKNSEFPRPAILQLYAQFILKNI